MSLTTTGKKELTPTESGYYWCYAFDNDGNTLEIEGKPSVVWYQCVDDPDEPDELHLIGYDVPLPYCPKRYQLLARLEYFEYRGQRAGGSSTDKLN